MNRTVTKKLMKGAQLSLAMMLAGTSFGQLNSFVESTTANFSGAYFGMPHFVDLDNDNDMDVIVSGQDANYNTSTAAYLNDGNGVYTVMTSFGFPNMERTMIATADVNGDGFQDVFISGDTGGWSPEVKLYINNQDLTFTESTGQPFLALMSGQAIFVDVDGDNDMDLLQTGGDEMGMPTTRLYKNDGLGNFTNSNQFLMGLYFSSLAVADVDGDGDVDFALIGYEDTDGDATLIYKNDGSGVFTLDATNTLQPLSYGSVELEMLMVTKTC